jgi:hypothetical protein
MDTSMEQLRAEQTRLHNALCALEASAASGMLDEAGLDRLRDTHAAYIANREARRAAFKANRSNHDALNALWAAKGLLDAINQQDGTVGALNRDGLAQHAFDTYGKIIAAIRSVEAATQGGR